MTAFDLLVIVTAFLGLLTFGAWLADQIGENPLDEPEPVYNGLERRRG